MPLDARLTADGTKIILRGFSTDLLSFYRTLPEARFIRTYGYWVCNKTPAALVRVLSHDEFATCCEKFRREAADAFGRFQHVRFIQDHATEPMLVPPTKMPLWRHQRKGFEVAATLGAALEYCGMGAGKSAIAVALVKHWVAHQTLIICPKSVLGVWRREFDRHYDGPIQVIVLGDGETVSKRCLRAKAAVETLAGPVAIVVNYEAVWRKPFGDWVLGNEWDCVILDESQKAKAHNSEIGKFVAKLHYHAKHRLCLTGTPMSQGPTDLYGQFRFLDPGVFGTTWTGFCDQFVEKLNPSVPQMITGYKNQDILKERMAWMTFHCKSEDVLDLPAVHHIERRFKLSKEGQRVYNAMLDDMIAEFKDGVCSAANAMVKALRLAQVTSGYLQHDDSDVVEEFDQEKLDHLRGILEELDTAEPVVVFCRFRRDLDRIARLAAELGRRYGEISGDRKDALTENATMRSDIDLAGVQIAAGGLGIDLTRASYCVYYSIGYSLAEYAQSVARLHRPGQTRPVHYYHLIADNTVDCDVYQAMEKKREIIDAILDVFGVQKPLHHAAGSVEDGNVVRTL